MRKMTNSPWNHNAAYYPELLRAVPGIESTVLDIGCGDGMLLEQLATCSQHVIGIDSDAASVTRACARLEHLHNVEIIFGDLLTAPELLGRQVDLITCVATLHHMPLVRALTRMRGLLAPGGELRIVGLSASKDTADWIADGLRLLPARIAGAMHRESNPEAMVTTDPQESLAEIRQAAEVILPGCRIRRRMYYRYTLSWTRPSEPMR